MQAAAAGADRVEVARGARPGAALEDDVRPSGENCGRESSSAPLVSARSPVPSGADREEVAAADEGDRVAVRGEGRFGVGRVFGQLVECCPRAA